MTREAFIAELKGKSYSYEIEGDKIIVTNNGYVSLNSLTSLPPGVEFKNKGVVYLSALTSIPPGVEFRNGGMVNLESMIGGWIMYWRGNIEGIDPKDLFNLMIKQGIFER